MKNNNDNPNGIVIFLIIAVPMLIGVVIGVLTYQPPRIHARNAAAVVQASAMATAYMPIVP